MFKRHALRSIGLAIVGLILAFVASQFAEKVYEGRVQLLISEMNNKAPTRLPEEVAQILGEGQSQTVSSALTLLRSQDLFYEALRKVEADNTRNDLTPRWKDFFSLYDVEGVIADNPFAQSNIVLVRARANDPKLAADLANEISDLFNERREKAAKASIFRALNVLDKQVSETRAQVTAKDVEYRSFKESIGIADLPSEMQSHVTMRTALRQSIDGFTRDIAGLAAQIETMRDQLRRTKPRLQGGVTDAKRSVVTQLENQLADAERRRAVLLEARHDDAYEVRLVDGEIQKIKTLLASERGKENERQSSTDIPNPNYQDLQQKLNLAIAGQDAAHQQLNRAQEELATLDSKVAQMPAQEAKIMSIIREKNVLEDRYRMLRQNAEDVRTRSEAIALASHTLFPAMVDRVPIAPNVLAMVLLGALGGFLIGLILSVSIEALQMRIHSPIQLAEVVGLPVAVAFARLPAARSRRALLALGDAEGRPAEAFKYMAFAAIGRMGGKKQAAMFTGVRRRGNTAISASQYALAMARAGVPTLLVDADFGRPVIGRAVRAEAKSGLSDVLSAPQITESLIDGSIVDSPHPNLQILPAGTVRNARIGDFPLPKIESVAEILRAKVQCVVYSVGPCDVVSDATAIAKHVDDTFVVVSAKATSYRDLPNALSVLRQAGAGAIQFILSDTAAGDEFFSTTAHSEMPALGELPSSTT